MAEQTWTCKIESDGYGVEAKLLYKGRLIADGYATRSDQAINQALRNAGVNPSNMRGNVDGERVKINLRYVR